MPAPETKLLPLTLSGLKMPGDGSGAGILEGYGSTFNNVDSYADTIQPGAYAETIGDFLADGCITAQHDWARRIGYPTDAREDAHGLFIRASFHSTPDAQAERTVAAERLSAGKSVGLSIGYEPQEWDMRQVDTPVRNRWGEFTDKVRVLTKIKLFEIALVTVPADEMALATGVKGSAWERLAALLSELKAGARNSAADLKLVQAIHDLSTQLDAQCAEPKAAPSPEHLPLWLDAQRTLARLHGVAV